MAGIQGDIAAGRPRACVVLAVLRIASANACCRRRETGVLDHHMVRRGGLGHRIRNSSLLITSPRGSLVTLRDPRTLPGHRDETSFPRHPADTVISHPLLDLLRLENDRLMAVLAVAQGVRIAVMSGTPEPTRTREGRGLL